MEPGPDYSRVLFARPGTSKSFFLYHEISTPASSGVLDAVDRWDELPFDELRDMAARNHLKPLRPLTQQPARGQQEMFVGL